jgi:lincosamide nucleotidyltransferase B/F
MQQLEMIETVRRRCREDERISAAVMYGSFAKGAADEFSDIEFYLFIRQADYDLFNLQVWIRSIAPVELFLVNEYGTTVAVFQNLVRGEFHVGPEDQVKVVSTWGMMGEAPNPATMVIIDRKGALDEQFENWRQVIALIDSAENYRQITSQYVNMILFGANVLKRGERVRALELLFFIHRYLLWLARMRSGQVRNWPTPSRMIEQDLPADMYSRFTRCTANMDPGSLERAYLNSWEWGKEMMQGLGPRFDYFLPASLIESIDARFALWFAPMPAQNDS